jgi:hypothetical protein
MDDVLLTIRDGKEGRDADWYTDTTKSKWGQSDEKMFAVVPFETIRRSGKPFLLVEA